MPRWKPDAKQRLIVAALTLFTEHGYDATTVAEIADRAGLTRSTFFRHFSDKREILTAGQTTLSRLLVEGIEGAPAEATPLAAVGAGLERASGAMTSFNRDLSPLLRAAIEANEELRQRDALKIIGLAAAMTESLTARGVPGPAAQVAAEIGVLAFKDGFARWTDPAHDQNPGDLATYTSTALAKLAAAVTELS